MAIGALSANLAKARMMANLKSIVICRSRYGVGFNLLNCSGNDGLRLDWIGAILLVLGNALFEMRIERQGSC